jgi:hypothetical protein
MIPPEHYWFLWKVSWFSLLAALFAMFLGHYEFAIVPGSVFLTSILYWCEPDYSWRRYLDMGVVVVMFVYQAILAWGTANAGVYYTLALIGALCFPLAVALHQQNMAWPSTVAHAGIHVLGNMANIILYCGL